MKTYKRVLAVILCVVLTLTAAPLGGFVGLDLPSLFGFEAEAAEVFDDPPPTAPTLPSSILSGTCGERLFWTLDANTGVLEISGTGEMTDYTDNSKAPWVSYRSYIKVVKINTGITSIGDYSFYFCENLQSLTIPYGVTIIGHYAFYCCDSLEKITIPESVTTIGFYAFRGCETITSIILPESLKHIYSDAFSDCKISNLYYNGKLSSWCTINFSSGLANPLGSVVNFFIDGKLVEGNLQIPKDVTTIGNYAFAYCDSLTSVTIPDSVTTIGEEAFYGCDSLTSVTIGNSVTTIGEDAFYGCDSLTSVTIGNSVTTIGKEAFYNCDSLTSVTIPDSVTTIGEYAFYSCDSLTSITVSANNKYYSSDSYGVLFNKDKTTLIQYPIGNERTSYTIPNGVITIGCRIFDYLPNLSILTIPNSVKNIEKYAFSQYNSIIKIYFEGTREQWDSILLNNNIYDHITIICFEENAIIDSGKCGDNLTWTLYESGQLEISGNGAMKNYSISSSAPWHSYSSYIISLKIGNGVTTIGNYAFFNLYYLASVTIADSVTTIGNYAFAWCDYLTNVPISANVKNIGFSPFAGCDKIKQIDVDKHNAYFSTDEYGVLYNKSKTHLICFPCGSELTEYNIPNSVTNIGQSAFSSSGASFFSPIRDSLQNIVIPNSVTIIGNYAFSYCTSLTSVTIGNSVTTIGNSAFYHCDDLTSVTIGNSVTTIGDKAFYSCDSLTSITIPDSVTTIGSEAFANCDKLTSINVDSGNKYYSSDSYGVLFNKNKTKLIQYPIGNARTSYTIPDSVTTIGEDAFSFCDSLTSVTIPDSVTTIGSDAFYNCTSLTSVTIPDSVTTIGKYAFSSCTSLKDVYYTGTKTQWENISIGSYNEPLMNATIHWPDKVVSENIDYYIKYGDNDYRGVTINATIADSSFSQDSAVYNHDLARLCSQFTVVGYTSGDGNESSKNQVMKNALKKLGFDTPVVDLSAERTSVNHFITHKKITVNGEEYTLIFMGFIGSYHEQWYSNFDPGKGATHQGFRQAANNMLLKFYEYVKEYKLNLDKNKTKFLITGHSRGAATANLVAADLIKSETFAIKENIYTYAFATPNSTTLEERNNAEYKRIFNIVNPEDFVTKAMPTKWGYGRYGTTYVLPSKTNTSNKEYKIYRANMQQYFGVLTNGEKYEPYIDGENATYCAVSSLTQSVKDVNKFYSVPLWAGSIPVTAYYFFQNSLCHFVSKTASVADYGTAAILILGTLSSTNSSAAYREILNYFVVYSLSTDGIYISGRFEDAHRAETYCAYMMSMSETQIKQTRKGYLNTVNCPVDIEVIDNETGEVVGRIVNNIIDEEIAAKENALVMNVDGDSKSFWLPSDGDYEVKLIGNGEGTMDYTVAEIDPDLGEQERVNFFDVEITDGKEMTGDVPAEKFVLEEYTLKTDSGEETPDQKLDAESGEITITTSVEGDGYITNTLTVKSGDYVTLNAQPVVTAEFVKWVDSNGKTLSTDAEYSFVAKENITVKAVFTTATGISIRTASTTTVKYGDTLILHADFGDIVLPEGYSILWTVEGAGFNMVPADDGLTCNMTSVANGNATVKATLVDENGEAVLDAEGNEMSDTQEIKSNASFWQKIVSFLKNLFRINRIIPE